MRIDIFWEGRCTSQCCRRLLSAFVERVKIIFILLQIYFADKKLHNSFAPSLANILQISCLSIPVLQTKACPTFHFVNHCFILGNTKKFISHREVRPIALVSFWQKCNILIVNASYIFQNFTSWLFGLSFE